MSDNITQVVNAKTVEIETVIYGSGRIIQKGAKVTKEMEKSFEFMKEIGMFDQPISQTLYNVKEPIKIGKTIILSNSQ